MYLTDEYMNEGAQTRQYGPATGRAVPNNGFSAAQNYIILHAEIDHEELRHSVEIANCYLECSVVGAEYSTVDTGIGGCFLNTSEPETLRYQQPISDPDTEAWTIEIINEHSRMVKNKDPSYLH